MSIYIKIGNVSDFFISQTVLANSVSFGMRGIIIFH